MSVKVINVPSLSFSIKIIIITVIHQIRNPEIFEEFLLKIMHIPIHL